MAETKAYWFNRMAQAVRDIVDEHGGAVLMTRFELIEAIVQEDGDMGNCPDAVFDHLTCGLRRTNLGVCSYQDNDPNVLLVFDNLKGEEYARAKCPENEHSEAVELYLLGAR